MGQKASQSTGVDISRIPFTLTCLEVRQILINHAVDLLTNLLPNVWLPLVEETAADELLTARALSLSQQTLKPCVRAQGFTSSAKPNGNAARMANRAVFPLGDGDVFLAPATGLSSGCSERPDTRIIHHSHSS